MGKTNDKSLESNVFNSVKKDCFAYGSISNKCSALNELYCKKENCKFYKTKESMRKEG